MEKIIFISDTHGLHDRINLPDGDVLVHAGDIYGDGRENNQAGLVRFLKWFDAQPHTFKLFIPGNHDFFLESNDCMEYINSYKSVECLCDSSVEIDGIKFYGSPWTRWLPRWAFQLPTDEDAKRVWSRIPEDTDVLITHGPPKGILDTVLYRKPGEDGHVGCPMLAERLTEIKPKIHVFGHIHEARGEVMKATHFINASSVDFNYELYHEPYYIAELA